MSLSVGMAHTAVHCDRSWVSCEVRPTTDLALVCNLADYELQLLSPSNVAILTEYKK